ncbi:MAG TPA: 2'-5' RNA ligase family protein [Streptosporangiaceae bacterium]
MTDPGLESALVVEVPEAEAAVAGHRERLDENAAMGIPAHITVMAPFLPPAAIGPPVLDELSRLFGGLPRFRFWLARTAWFGDQVLWLAPDDPGPFRALTGRVFAAFPACPPYGGQHEDVIPHLTVGLRQPLADMRAAEEALRPHLPIEAQAAAVALLVGPASGGQWTRTARFPLA